MGGNALKSVNLRRLDAEEYFGLVSYLLPIVQKTVPESTLIRAYRKKESFGDMDILCQADESSLLDIAESFKPTEIVENGCTVSFDVDRFQIDLIGVSSWCFQVASDYFAYNDLGNLMGRIAHTAGFKYGHTGLIYPVREGANIVDELELSVHPPYIFRFLGYDYIRFAAGFDTLEEIFQYAISSPFFDPAAYQPENQNHRARTRDRKRDSYQKFLAYIDGLDPYPLEPERVHPISQLRILDFFPALAYREKLILGNIDRHREAKARLLNILVPLGYKERELGAILDAYRARFDDQHILARTEDELMSEFVTIIFESAGPPL